MGIDISVSVEGMGKVKHLEQSKIIATLCLLNAELKPSEIWE